MAQKVMPNKQPWEDLDYDFIYDGWLARQADTVGSVVLTVEALPGEVADVPETTLVIEHKPKVVTTTACKYWAKAGTGGVRYKVTARMVTAGGRSKEDEHIIPVGEA